MILFNNYEYVNSNPKGVGGISLNPISIPMFSRFSLWYKIPSTFSLMRIRFLISSPFQHIFISQNWIFSPPIRFPHHLIITSWLVSSRAMMHQSIGDNYILRQTYFLGHGTSGEGMGFKRAYEISSRKMTLADTME